jgi:hypothetical protein
MVSIMLSNIISNHARNYVRVHKYAVGGKKYTKLCSVGTVHFSKIVSSRNIRLDGELIVIVGPSAVDARTNML